MARKETYMLKVYILDLCPYCDGKAYQPAGEASNWKGETYTRYAPCQRKALS